MIEIAHIDHISMAVADLDAQVALLEGLFGFRARGSWTDEEGGYQGASLEVPGRSGIDWEVMAPLAGDNQIQRFLDGPRGPGLHHITFEVANVDVAMGQLLALGIEPWGVRPAAAGEPAQELYVHPRLGHGFLFQLTAPAPASWHLDAEAASATTAGTAPTSPPAEQATGGPPAAVEASEDLFETAMERGERLGKDRSARVEGVHVVNPARHLRGNEGPGDGGHAPGERVDVVFPIAPRGFARCRVGMRRYAPGGSHGRPVHLPDLRQRQCASGMREPGRGDGLSIDPVRGIGVALYLVRPNHRRGDRRSAGGVRALLGISRRSRGAGRERRRLRR